MNYGVSDHARVECKVSKHHGSFPANERCPWCEPIKTHHVPVPMDFDWLLDQTWDRHNQLDDTYTTVDGTYTVTGSALRKASLYTGRAIMHGEPEDPDTDAYQYMVFP